MTNDISAAKFAEAFNYFYFIFVPSDKTDADAYRESIIEFTSAIDNDKCGEYMLKRVKQEFSPAGYKEGTYLLIPITGRLTVTHIPDGNRDRSRELCASGVICTEYGIIKGAQKNGTAKWSVVSAGEANKVSGSTTPYLRMRTISEDTNTCKY